MNINVIFDSSVTNAGGPPQAFQDDVHAVTSYLESQYTDNITFNLHVGYGERDGTALGASSLGESVTFSHSYSYSQIINALNSHNNTGDDGTAYATLPGSDPVSGTHTWWVANPEAEALGLLTNTTVDEYVGFADSAHATFDYDRSNGIAAGQFDFIGTVFHEVTEVMGRQLGVEENHVNNKPTDNILDLFHYSSAFTRDFSRGGYFSFDNGNTNRGDFNSSDPNGDAGDWAASVTKDALLDISNSGVYNNFSQNDMRLMDVIGYNRRVDDFGDDTNFAGQVAVHGSVTGNLENILDSDWFRVQLTAGVHYTMRVAGTDAGAGTLQHPFVAVYDSSSTELSYSQELDTTHDARLEFTPTSSGFYYVDASSFFGGYTGSYNVHIDTDDFLGDTSTNGALGMGASKTGDLEITGDHDWFAVRLTAGHNYLINERGAPSGGGTLSDAFVQLHDSSGAVIAHDDDSGVGFDSQMTVHVSTTGTYYIDSGAYADAHTGTYTVNVQDLEAASHDFNFDLTSDVLWRNNSSGHVGTWEMHNGAPTWHDLGFSGVDHKAVGVGDFNGDGTSDILWRNDSTGHVGSWEMHNGSPTWHDLGFSGVDHAVVGIGDFHGDGTSDILWRNDSSGHVGSWEMHNGSPTWHDLGYSGVDHKVVGVGDFNGDGTSDILWRNDSSGHVGTWEMHNGSPTWHDLGYSGVDHKVVGVGDFNGDGTSDILWRNDSTGHVGWWEMQNGSPTWHDLGYSGVDHKVVEVADFNGDGTSDILWRNDSTGHVGSWEMHNGSPTWHDLGFSGVDHLVIA